jgi:NAD(P)-dependent dehydrogenase (short-subunit alcohol dehydrogenase family)
MNKKRIAIVTGVSRLNGIGKAICMELAKQGIDIFFTYWTQYDKEMAKTPFILRGPSSNKKAVPLMKTRRLFTSKTLISSSQQAF